MLILKIKLVREHRVRIPIYEIIFINIKCRHTGWVNQGLTELIYDMILVIIYDIYRINTNIKLLIKVIKI